ncbi:NTP transferase domain-containing protein [Balneola sp. MJW-20]|uniref:nucleotidyltransferase family protein n=1 Tax=Gracilimonas aurantiaca TaxID=3234185 RepID=UPI003464F0D7
MTDKTHIGVIVLAAGSSSRLGKPKQLVRYKGKSLLQHTLDTVKETGIQTAVLVTGANSELITEDLQKHAFITVHNNDWQEGMAGSIRAGLKQLTNTDPQMNGVLIMVSDQPFISAELMDNLCSAFKDQKDLVVSEYRKTVGVPAIIGRHYFDDLNKLTGDTGAKKIMMSNPEHLKKVRFEKGDIDIDTSADIDRLNRIES